MGGVGGVGSVGRNYKTYVSSPFLSRTTKKKKIQYFKPPYSIEVLITDN
ncbi:MAG: hypothetical protein F6K40_15780 [Okeania sp. SIO3I5]|nr:hypothetical protein [Okeania sp. SIO3I5]NEQ37643.1 hypothetical protein [Okeania sp. SIO3I5]